MLRNLLLIAVNSIARFFQSKSRGAEIQCAVCLIVQHDLPLKVLKTVLAGDYGLLRTDNPVDRKWCDARVPVPKRDLQVRYIDETKIRLNQAKPEPSVVTPDPFQDVIDIQDELAAPVVLIRLR